jgi:uncharacterized membrane protein
MSKLDIDIVPLFKYAYEVYRKYASFVIGVMVTYFILGLVPQLFLYVHTPEDPTTDLEIFSFIAMIVRVFLSLGFTKIMLYLIDNRPVEITDLVNNGRILLSYIAAYFIYFIVVGIGLVLLIIPGIYLAVRLQFYPYYIIENHDASIVAFQKSWYATEGFIIELVAFGACVLILNFIGALFFGIGLIFTYPLTTMATAALYQSLEENAEQLPASRYAA